MHSVSLEGSFTSLGTKACSKVMKQESTFPFLLFKDIVEIFAEVAQSILIFSFFMYVQSQHISGGVMKSSLLGMATPEVSMQGTWLCLSLTLSKS